MFGVDYGNLAMKPAGAIRSLFTRFRFLNRGHGPFIGALTMLILLHCPFAWAAENASADWQVGYYAWDTSYRPLETKTVDGKPLPLLYVEVGEVWKNSATGSCGDSLKLRLPASLPPAGRYVAVVRFGGAPCLDRAAITALVKSFIALRVEARSQGRALSGLQVDYDCPTGQLPDYARFLEGLRRELPKDDLLSISALLDWFRPGTKVSDVIARVDEFVPQFYDVAPERSGEPGAGVARVIEPEWGARFNRFGKPYRVAIASFGRIVEIPARNKRARGQSGSSSRIIILDDTPLELMKRARLGSPAVSASRAGERLVIFGNVSDGSGGDPGCFRESVIKMIIPTGESVSRAYAAARAMGGWCRGALFFRWPVTDETMALTQAELEAVIAGKDFPSERTLNLESEDGLCVAVNCADVRLRLGKRFPEKPVKIRVHSSCDLEYFLPDPLLPSKLTGKRTIDLTIPAFAGVPEINLGRAVTMEPARFRVEEVVK